jgi:lysophospholipase L1-like esterase
METTKETEPFSQNPLMIGYDCRIFEGDDRLGFRFPEGKLISRKGFVSLDETAEKLIKVYPTFLNIGDSSTSGWDSNRTFKGNQDPYAPFFSYKTYSTLLEEKFFFNAINAGVPGYTSYQGVRYLEYLLRVFSRKRIKIDYVTIYFGNNDCTYNKFEDKVRLDGKVPSTGSYGERVTAEDYEKNIKIMVSLCREYGIKPIIIVPPVHYDWEPAIRADKYREESLEILRNMNNRILREDLEKARQLYEQGKFKNACEKDRILPRLKKAYRRALFQAAKETKADVVDVQSRIPLTDNAGYFADYCHPLEQVNLMIVEEIKKIREKNKHNKTLAQRIKSFLGRIIEDKQNSDSYEDGPPQDIYTLW